MRRLRVALVIVAMVGLMWPLVHRAASLTTTRATFRVVTFNIHKGADRRGHYDLDRTIEAIARLDPDLVAVQEAMRNHPDFDCDDQPALIAAGLRRHTGRPWRDVFEKAWITDHTTCRDQGRGADIETEGVAILSAEPILSSSTIRLSEGRVGLAVRLGSLPDVPIIATHLSANLQAQADREREIAKLIPWAVRQGPGLLLGDLNARPDASELAPVLAAYRDSWVDAVAVGRAGGVLSGSTRPGRRVSRIDYVFYAPDIDMTLQSVDIIDTATLPGLGEVSDHHPVVATFLRHPATQATRAGETR